MSATPGALEPSHFKLIATEVSGWLWGTVQGAWNEKQTVSQIIVDAVIGMIPLVGDATAVRDLMAVGTGMAESTEKRESKWQWVLLVVLLLALIPILGGVLKGVGRLTIRAAEDVMKESAKLEQLARDLVALLNRLGHKDAVQWLKALDFGRYEAQLVERCRAFCDTVILAINRYALKLPEGEGGRPPVGLERTLRMLFVQHWFNLADETCEEALYDSASLRRFVGIDLGRERVPDATTLLSCASGIVLRY